MNKLKLVAVGLIAGGIIGGGVILGQNLLAGKKTEVKVQPTLTPTPTVEKTVWDDQSGFTFEYPKNLTLDPHDEDKTNYAHVELTDKDHPGKIIFWAKDTQVADLNSYLKLNKITSSLESTLGGVEAKKMIAGSEEKIIKVATIKDGYLYEVEYYPNDESYWNPIFDNLLASYKFKPSETKVEEEKPQAAPQEDTSGGDFAEEESVE